MHAAPFQPCLLIPVYNHGTLIEATYEKLRRFQLPCIVVDDGSDADTANVLQNLAERETQITLLRLPQNSGKGAAVMCGIAAAQAAGYTHALQIDADGQHNADDIPALLALAEKNPTALVSGAPQYGDDIPRARLYGRHITHFWVWIETLSFDIVDSMCGFRVYPVASTHDLMQRKAISRRMAFDTDIMVRLHWSGIPVLFLPTRVCYPANGISHFRGLRDNLQISWLHTRLTCTMLAQQITRLLGKKMPQMQHWSQQRERGSAWLMRFSLWCYRRFGRQCLYAFLYPIIAWFFLFALKARKESQRFLSRTLQRKPTWMDSYWHFMAFGRSVVDKFSAWNGDIRREDVRFEQRELLLQQTATGKGAVILTSHLGNADMCRALIHSAPNIHINVLLFTQHAQHINTLLQQLNPDVNLEIIQINEVNPGTAMLLHEKIQRGEFVVIAADRTSPTSLHRTARVPFLGESAAFPQGPFILASLLECPVFLLFALHNGEQYNIVLEPFSEKIVLPRRQRETLLQTVIQQYAARLEHYCRLTPLQWFNFYNFWQRDE
jgi:predicted LPLAT superfamily acyltransferase